MMREGILREMEQRTGAAKYMHTMFGEVEIVDILSGVGSCRELRRFLSAVSRLHPSRAQIECSIEIIHRDQALDRFAAVAMAMKERRV